MPLTSISFSRSGWDGEKELNHQISFLLTTKKKLLPHHLCTSGTSAEHINLAVFEVNEEASPDPCEPGNTKMRVCKKGGMLPSLTGITVCKGNTSCAEIEKNEYGTKGISVWLISVLSLPAETPDLWIWSTDVAYHHILAGFDYKLLG